MLFEGAQIIQYYIICDYTKLGTRNLEGRHILVDYRKVSQLLFQLQFNFRFMVRQTKTIFLLYIRVTKCANKRLAPAEPT